MRNGKRPACTRKVVIQVQFLPREEGQGLVEYALILVLIAVVVIAVMLLLGPIIGDVFSNILSSMAWDPVK